MAMSLCIGWKSGINKLHVIDCKSEAVHAKDSKSFYPIATSSQKISLMPVAYIVARNYSS